MTSWPPVDGQHVLECQSCGEVLRRLTAAEAQAVAREPYSHVRFCVQCRADGLHVEAGYRG